MTSSTNAPTLTRRDFLALSGAAVGLAAVGTSARAENQVKFDPDAVTNTDHTTDVLVIGGGMAGLFAAVKAHDAGAATMIVSKGRLGSSGLTPFGKGFFVFDADQEGTSLDEFVDTVSRSAHGTNNPVYTRQMAEHSKARVEELRAWVYFEQTLANRPFMQPIVERDIPLIERVVITHLLKEDGRIAGAAGFRLDIEETITIQAKSVILCTSSGGFKPSGFPVCDLTHDGSIMAYQIGAKVTGKEWNDGHNTRAVNPAACYDNWGDMFGRIPSTNGVDVHHDLGVDISYRAYANGNPVTGGPGSAPSTDTVEGGPFVPEEFRRTDGPSSEGGPCGNGDERPSGPPPGASEDGAPGGDSGDRPSRPPPGVGEGGAPGGDTAPGFTSGATMGGASAGMAIHKSEGLVPADERCASNIAGLYAAGDALGSHMVAGAAVGTFLLAWLPVSALQLLMAGMILGYIMLRLLWPDVQLQLGPARKLLWPAGFSGGVLQGAAGVSSPIAVTFLNAMRISRPKYIFTVSVYFAAMSATQLFVLMNLDLITIDIAVLGTLALIPLFIALPVGERIGQRISPVAFDRVILTALAVLAIRMIWNELS